MSVSTAAILCVLKVAGVVLTLTVVLWALLFGDRGQADNHTPPGQDAEK